MALTSAGAIAQRPAEQLTSGELLHEMQKLGRVGSVLYLAAHPDDENTRIISYFEGDRQLRTAYLSLTRGDGGQNLIGPELGDGLGVIRTQELLEARRLDGGEQFFTRAVDFGYSKSPEEALAKWGKEEVLGDVVRVVRTFRPDIIITRFDVDGSGGHGHHTASALLAREAFEVAADPGAYPEQIAEGLEPWQTKRLFFNGSVWWNADLPNIAREHPDEWLSIDVGGYNPLLGASYNEIAARARSMHKSQGFGAFLPKGSQYEYLRLELGAPMETADPFDGIELGWDRVLPGARARVALQGASFSLEIDALVASLVEDFEASHPERSIPQLNGLIGSLEGHEALPRRYAPPGLHHWVAHHRRATEELLLQLAGASVELRSKAAEMPTSGRTDLELVVTQRARGDLFRITGVLRGDEVVLGGGRSRIPFNESLVLPLPPISLDSFRPDEPYWLTEPHGTLYRPAPGYRGIEPVSRSQLVFGIGLGVGPHGDLFDRHAVHTFVERVDGQRTRNAVVTPVASLHPIDRVQMVRGQAVEVPFELEALADDLTGEVHAEAPAGWTVEPESFSVQGMKRGEVARFTATLKRGDAATRGALGFSFAGPLGEARREMHVIDYPHIQPQVWYSPAEVDVVPLDVTVTVDTVGYVKGAGDDLPRAMERLGITVVPIDPETAGPEDLARCQSIVIGIRAYNVEPAMARLQPLLMDFVASGGTVLTQYNTASGDLVLPPSKIGPYPFALTRGRVTVEEAAPTFLAPEHPLMGTPNRLSGADFDGWVQERGLYFVGERDDAYTPLIAWADPGESPLDGALITAEHGEGRFTYTGISLFRQLPAGVPGAYRLLANLLARR